MQRDIKTLLIILRDNLDWAVEGCGLSRAIFNLVDNLIISQEEDYAIDTYLKSYFKQNSICSFADGEIEPRRKFLDEIIEKL
jgi:hypothetical protein